MPRREVTKREKEEITRRVKEEFPGSKPLQEIHYYRYLKELEWETMSNQEILKDIKAGANEAKKRMEKGKTKV